VTVEKERKEAEWESRKEVRTIAANQEKMKDSVEALCPTRHEEQGFSQKGVQASYGRPLFGKI